jgi:hypothetical protein
MLWPLACTVHVRLKPELSCNCKRAGSYLYRSAPAPRPIIVPIIIPWKYSSLCTFTLHGPMGLVCVHVHVHVIYMYMYSTYNLHVHVQYIHMYKFLTCFLTLSSSQYCFSVDYIILQGFVSSSYNINFTVVLATEQLTEVCKW